MPMSFTTKQAEITIIAAKERKIRSPGASQSLLHLGRPTFFVTRKLWISRFLYLLQIMYIIYGQFKNSPVRFANVKVFSMDLTLWILGEVTTDRIKETSETIKETSERCSLAFPLWIGRSWIKKAFPELWSGSLQASSDFVSFPPSFISHNVVLT